MSECVKCYPHPAHSPGKCEYCNCKGPVRPFIKAVGGKRSSLPFILPKLQAASDDGNYYEPFLGGGAVFFALAPRRAHLNDTNVRLMDAYMGVKHDVDTVIKLLKEMPYDEAFFMKVRQEINVGGSGSSALDAAQFIYLNKTCFNGLWRVNKQGKFNVPFGDYTNPTICDEEGLRSASEALQRTFMGSQDFDKALRTAQKGDRVYLDPPYTPVSKTANFTGYTKDGFSFEDQKRLSVCVADVAKRSALVVLSSADTPETRALYTKKFYNLEEVKVSRAINSDPKKRGKVGELLITPKKGMF